MEFEVSEVFSGSPSDTDGLSEVKKRSYAFLDGLGIEFERVDHWRADTIEHCLEVEKALNVKICKNLFLCNRQETDFYLLMMPGEKVFKTKFLSKALGVSRLSFGTAENLEKHLGLRPGSVSVLGLMNDTDKKVRLIIDREVLDDEFFGCHPCDSTSSLKIKTDDLVNRILPALGTAPTVIDLPTEE